MTSSSETFTATRASLLPGLTGAYRVMLGGAMAVVAAFFLIQASPHMAVPALLTFDAAGAPSLELLEPLPEAVASREAVFVVSGPPESCAWQLTLPATATTPHRGVSISGAHPTSSCATSRPSAMHGSLIALERARPLADILVPALASRR